MPDFYGKVWEGVYCQSCKNVIFMGKQSFVHELLLTKFIEWKRGISVEKDYFIIIMSSHGTVIRYFSFGYRFCPNLGD